jgi:hypothetical protein
MLFSQIQKIVKVKYNLLSNLYCKKTAVENGFSFYFLLRRLNQTAVHRHVA